MSQYMKRFDVAINILIVFNAFAFGLLTDKDCIAIHPFLLIFCHISNFIFVIELIIKIVYYKQKFFTGSHRRWNLFDMFVIILASLGSIPYLSSIRIFRIIRVFRQLNILRSIPASRNLKIIIEAILLSLPGVMWTAVLFFILIYSYGLLGTEFFGQQFPDWFGNIWKSIYTLFQVMTLESWSMGIARPVIAVYPGAWIYFISYIVLSAYIILNIIVALVLNSLQEVAGKTKANDLQDKQTGEMQAIEVTQTLEEIKTKIARLQILLEKNNQT